MRKHLLLVLLLLSGFAKSALSQHNSCAGQIITSFAGGRSFDFFYQVSGFAQPTMWIWDYGDGTVDTTQFASHTYATAGGYSVTCTAISHTDSCHFTAQDSVHIQGQGHCTGEILVSRNGNYFTLAAHRTGGSNSATYRWTTPNHGTYFGHNTITNYVPDSLLTDTLTWCVEMADHWISGCVVNTCVKVAPGPVHPPTRPCHASFVVVPDTSRGGLNYLVYNHSTGTHLTYTWTFGDGAISHDPAPTHTYADTGNYIICLTVNDSAGNCTSSFCDSSMLGARLMANAVTIRVVPAIPTAAKTSLNMRLTVWPVPAKEVLHLSAPLQDYSIFSLSGNLVAQGHAETNSISVKHLPAGTYLLQGNGAGGLVRQLIVTER